ncbi:MAG: AraC family transcriptional regulator ligand-binding domain-containing protein [Nannocystaceae bacterium]
MADESTLLASAAAPVVMYALARGLTMDDITAASGLRREDLIDADARLPSARVGAVLRLLAARFPGEAVGVHMAQAAPFSFFGPLAHAARYAGSVRDALAVFVRNRNLLAERLHLALIDGAQEVVLEMSHPLDHSGPGPGPELAFGVGARFVRECVHPRCRPTRVEFSHPRRGPLATYREHFAAEVLFERPRNAMVFAADALALPVQGADPVLYRFIQGHLELARERLLQREPDPALTRVRAAISVNAERGEYGGEALAKRLGTSLRSLQRLVQGHGSSVRQLLDDAREADARALLGDPRLSVEEIAFLLGYSAESAFRRAFKRWTGETPASARRAARAV